MFGWLRRAKHSAAAAAERWVVVDVETSGLDTAKDGLISIGAVAMRGAPGTATGPGTTTIRRRGRSAGPTTTAAGPGAGVTTASVPGAGTTITLRRASRRGGTA
jgi:hypothetical protein